MIFAQRLNATLHRTARNCHAVCRVGKRSGTRPALAAPFFQPRAYAGVAHGSGPQEPGWDEEGEGEEDAQGHAGTGMTSVPWEEFKLYRKMGLICFGRLGRDLQVFTTKSGKQLAKTTMCINAAREGEPPQESWLKMDIWDDETGIVERAAATFKKGSWVAADGQLKRNEWVDRDGNPRTEYVLAVTSLARVEGAPKYSRQPE